MRVYLNIPLFHYVRMMLVWNYYREREREREREKERDRGERNTFFYELTVIWQYTDTIAFSIKCNTVYVYVF